MSKEQQFDKGCASPAELAHFMAGLFSKCHELEFNWQTLDKMLDVEGYLRDQAALACAPSHALRKHHDSDLEDGMTALASAPSTTPRSFSDFIRNASPEEKEKVYTEVMQKATERQNASMPSKCCDLRYIGSPACVPCPDNKTFPSAIAPNPYVTFFEAFEAQRVLPWFKDGRNDAEREAAADKVDEVWEAVVKIRRADGTAKP